MKNVFLLSLILNLFLSFPVYSMNDKTKKFIELFFIYNSKMTDEEIELVNNTWNKKLPSVYETERNRIIKINNLVNDYIKYTKDIDFYNKKEYVANPYKATINKKGDCEDYAILKIYLLHKVGIKNTKLVLVDNVYGENKHALVKVVFNNGKNTTYLDNAFKNPISVKKFNFYYNLELEIVLNW